MNSYKSTFLIPPVLCGSREVERVFGCTYGLYPIPNIFFLYVATIFLNQGYNVDYIDGPVMKWPKKTFMKFIKSNKSDIFLFYTVNLAKKTDLIAANYIRLNHPESVIIFMGPSPTYTPDDYLINQRSIVIRGEMEETALELSLALPKFLSGDDKILSSIKGISYRIDGRIIHNASQPPITDLDKLAFPSRHLLKKNKYYNPKLGVMPFTVLLTSRGCAFRCRYCVPNSQSFSRELAYRQEYSDYQKPPVAIRSYENVLSELVHLKQEGYKAISIIDDQFITNGTREIEISESLAKLGFIWGCLSRADRITEDIAKAFGENNCRYVDIGVESFSQEILDNIRKGATIDKMYKGIELLKKYSVPIKLNILLGASSKETIKSIRDTIKTVKELRVDAVMFSICNPFPGTEFWDIAKRNGWLLYPEYTPVDVQKQSTINYAHLSAGELEKEILMANRQFFLRPQFWLKYIYRMKNPVTFLKDFSTLIKKIT